jgi:hypothetical protein
MSLVRSTDVLLAEREGIAFVQADFGKDDVNLNALRHCSNE